MRLVVSSDWHGDWITDGFERTNDLTFALEDIEHELQAGDVFIMLGDLSNPYSRLVHRAVGIAVDRAIRCNDSRQFNLWVVGNHDVVEDKHGSHTLMAVDAVGGLTRVFSKPSRQVINGVNFIALPYTSPVFDYSPEEQIRVIADSMTKAERNGPVVVMGHLMLEGIEPGSESTDMPRGRDIMFPIETVQELFPKVVMMNGHYHTKQTYRGVHIPGSLMRLTHGEEENEPGFMVIEI